jgi:23S rRNA (cytidine1920-2'-O)/16S rRNA (cytidine1409-2'-O)-methyltransferase
VTKPRFRSLLALVGDRFPDAGDPAGMVARGEVRVDGVIVANVAARARADAAVTWHPPRELKGQRKLAAILDQLEQLDQLDPVAIDGRVALDIGASTGGFTSELLRRGAARVYAVDVGFGQLLGSLRQDPRVVNLETTNAADLDGERVPDPIGLVTADVSFTPLSVIIAQVSERVRFEPDAELVSLVKPMFELQLGALPTDESQWQEAVDRARSAITAAGWECVAAVRSPLLGHRGAVEFAVQARRGGVVSRI